MVEIGHPPPGCDILDEKVKDNLNKLLDFATKPLEIQLGWAIVKKELLDDSTNKTWQQQEDLLKKYGEGLKSKGATNAQVRRRTVIEAVWDTMLYYTQNKGQLLETKYDWTKSSTSDGGLVNVGRFDSGGLGVYDWSPGNPLPLIGVCSSRKFH